MLSCSEHAITSVLILTGLPSPFRGQKPKVESRDTVAYYGAQDGSIMEVVSREYAAGKFSNGICQTWNDGAVYHGDCRVKSMADLARLFRLDTTEAQAKLYPQQRGEQDGLQPIEK